MSHNAKAQVVRWIDGDTVVLACDVWPDIVTYAHVRIEGYDAPEAGKPGYDLAKNRALELAPVDSTVTVILTETHRRSFIRFRGHVITPEGSIAEILTREGLTKGDFA